MKNAILKKKRMNAMKVISLLILGLLFQYQQNIINAQAPLCINAQPICSDATNSSFPNSINNDIPVGPDYGCLQRISGVNDVDGMVAPQWFYFEVSQSGDIELEIEQYNTTNDPIDLDFVMWGPFSDLTTGCNQVMNGESPIQCSSDPYATETIGLGVQGGGNFWFNMPFINAIDGTSTPPNGQTGEVYILLLTNSDQEPGTITVNQTGGSGATDCSITTPCDITVTAIPSTCDPSTNTYSVSGEITFSDQPTTGTLIVEDCNGNTTSFSAPFTSPQNYTLTGLTPDGNNCNISAYFSDLTACSSVANYQSPSACNCVGPNIIVNNLAICANGGSENLDNAIDPTSDAATITYHNSQTDAQNDVNPINNIVNTGGSYWIRAEDTGDPSCFNVFEIIIDVSNLTYSATITEPSCGNNNGEIIITASGGIGSLTYSIDGNTTNQNSQTFLNLTADSYDIVVTDSLGCNVTGTEVVGNLNGPSIDNTVVTHPLCFGDCDGDIQITVSGGSTPYNYIWTNQNGDTLNITSNTASNLCAGEYQIEVTDDNGCQTSNSVSITTPEELTYSISAQAPSCFGVCDGSLNVTVDGGTENYTILWTNEGGNPINGGLNEVDTLCGGTYSLLVTDDNGCQIAHDTLIAEPLELDAAFSGLSNDYCINDDEVLLVPTQSGGTFFGPGITDSIFNPTEASSGTHTIKYILGDAVCGDTHAILVNIDGPSAEFTANPTTTTVQNPIVTFENNSQNATSYLWNFGDGSEDSNEINPIHSFPSNTPGTYMVTLIAIDDNNCSDTYAQEVSINPSEIGYTIPNVFTPNGDHDNDNFKLVNVESVSDLDIIILNRWGNVVFESNEVNFKWNGKTNNTGEECSDGTYFYKINFKGFNNEQKVAHGHVQLISSKK